MAKVMQLEMVELRYEPGQAYVQRLALVTHDTSHPSCLSSWPRAMYTGIQRALGTCLALVDLGVLWHWQLAGHRGWASTLCRRYLETPWQMGCFRQERHYIQYLPKSTLKKNLAPGKDSSLGPGRLSLRRYTGYCTELPLLHSGRESGCGVTQTCS